MNQESILATPLFAFIVFIATNKGMLKTIKFKVPNGSEKFVYSELMYESHLE